MALKDRIRELRKAQGLSQEKLARQADLSLNLIGRLEGGQVTDPHYSALRGLAHALGVPIEELIREPALVGKDEAPAEDTGRSAEETRGEGSEYEPVYETWLEFANMFAERWEKQIYEGTFGLGEVKEFDAVFGALALMLRRLGMQEKQEQSPEYESTFGPTIGQAIGRLINLSSLLASESAKRFGEDDDLAQRRRNRDELLSVPDQAASADGQEQSEKLQRHA